ncbi:MULTISPECIES: hypothetical protein [unclassified Bradyrhizobium]|uniref:hypothetical protein n=1 Tax=unclassified Bradyrhizobium TaxID=2631580 RepID=UPI00291650DF|nr:MULTISPECIES: hypothetical protein [unclassified Bradyrhizobium]
MPTISLVSTRAAERTAMARSSTERRWCSIGAADLGAGLTNWRVSYLMGFGEIRRRYWRSRLGQFRETVSTGVVVAAVGVVRSKLWKVPISELMPFIAIWQILLASHNEAIIAIFVTRSSRWIKRLHGMIGAAEAVVEADIGNSQLAKAGC